MKNINNVANKFKKNLEQIGTLQILRKLHALIYYILVPDVFLRSI